MSLATFAPPSSSLPARSRIAALSRREQQVLSLMAIGRSNRGIARDLLVSEGAIEKHVASIFLKLGLVPADGVHRRVLAVLAHVAAR